MGHILMAGKRIVRREIRFGTAW